MPQAARNGLNVGRTATQEEAAVRWDRLPITIETAARLSTPVRFSLLVPTLAVMVSPAVLLAATATPALWAAADNPLAATQVVAGLGLWTALFIVPARRLLQRFGSQRSVRIEGGVVSVSDGTVLGWRSWQVPLDEFSGIARRLRSSLSGVRHELHLVHADPRKSLLIHRADHISQATIDAAGALLGLPPIPVAVAQPGLAAHPPWRAFSPSGLCGSGERAAVRPHRSGWSAEGGG
jgi:hypothetical protein